MPESPLLQPLRVGAHQLSHRIVMAPLTRMRARVPGHIPGDLSAEYYGQRASAGGLIITEATQISPAGRGYPATPGIHSQEQIDAWRLAVDAVHARGGLIFLQLWYVGRVADPSNLPGGALPVGPSPIRAIGTGTTASFGTAPHVTPRALATEEVVSLVNDFKQAARNALAAGFDGVELHGANGYLLDQFLRDGTNQRTDRYGGSVENRARLLLETVDAVSEVYGAHRVGVRLSPFGTFNDMRDSAPLDLFRYAIGALDSRHIAYVHLIEARQDADELGGNILKDAGAAPTAALFRRSFSGVLIGAGGFTQQTANEAIASGNVDAVAFGRLFISNPDLPVRFELGAPLNPYERATFYGGGAEGYIDYKPLTS